MPESLDAPIDGLDDLLGDLEAAVHSRRPEIDAAAPEHRRGARNLVRYTRCGSGRSEPVGGC